MEIQQLLSHELGLIIAIVAVIIAIVSAYFVIRKNHKGAILLLLLSMLIILVIIVNYINMNYLAEPANVETEYVTADGP